ncbi:S9 family peptidase [Shewanella sp. D64]|uniref:S9 family peptidase n=1 Tax=unclassified Shewanella TaxID=196818 RepID=UPI0022BA4F09|nr:MULTISPECIES: S9 family peptidase [unclassified Shewanella]MEC4728001.1 S9 family peptidase [Shewanella sp. D64]MEC4740154.1 S9 family peptidase [Shewanella sp. E94]WBJ95213.1 S9 family peptidase [Shewanella sp. MTB7]
MLTKKIIPTLLWTAIAGSLLLTGCAQKQTPPALTAQIQQAPLIPIEAFFNEQDISQLKASSDGKWLAFFKEYEGAKNIYLMPTGAELDTAVAITTSKDPVNSFRWSTDTNEIFFLRDSGGNENTQVYRLTLDTSKLKPVPQITALTKNNEVRYDLLEQPKEKTNSLVLMSNQDNPQQMDIYQLNIDSGKITNIFANTYGFSQVKLNKHGEPVLGTSSNPDNTSDLYAKQEGKWTSLIKTEFGESIDILSFDEANRQAYIRADIDGRDKQQLLRLDMTNGKLITLHKDPENESDVYEVLFNDEGQPLAVSYYGGRLRTYSLDNTFAQHWTKINDHFTQDVEITITDRNEKTGQWQLHVASDIDVGSDYRYTAKTGEIVQLFTQTPAIDPELLSKRQSISYQARDGVIIQAYLTLPKGQNSKLPTIILPHGGPWARDYWTLSSGYFNPIAQLLANRGYAVLQPNFRASTGFGKRFLNAGNKNWGTGSMQDDLTDGANYLVNQGIADKQRLGIMGASYGGYAALAGATFTPDLYQAVISYVGPSSLITLLESFPPHFRPYLGQFYSAVGDPEITTDRVDMQARSPINFVDNIKAPLMLVQGANDPRVTQIESDNIARVMHQQQLAVEYILAKDEGHGFRKRDNKLAYILAMEQFFAKHLGGRVDEQVTPTLSTHLDTLRVDVSRL